MSRPISTARRVEETAIEETTEIATIRVPSSSSTSLKAAKIPAKVKTLELRRLNKIPSPAVS